jgi:hypothetical protein
MIYLFDCDLNGSDSIQHLIDQKKIEYIPTPSQEIFERTCIKLLPKVQKDDLIIVDTIASLAETSRLDAKLGSDSSKNLLDKKHLYLDGDKNYLTVYSWSGDSIIRRLKNFIGTDVGCRVITTSHESEEIDPASLTKKRAPELNPALFKTIIRVTSDIFRMYELFDPIMKADGQSVAVPAGERMLQLRKSDDAVTKYHVVPEHARNVPKTMVVPLTGGLHRLYEKLHKRPTWLHIYGVAGVGKTTFICSEADPPPVSRGKKEVALDATPAETVISATVGPTAGV